MVSALSKLFCVAASCCLRLTCYLTGKIYSISGYVTTSPDRAASPHVPCESDC